MLIYLPMVHFI